MSDTASGAGSNGAVEMAVVVRAALVVVMAGAGIYYAIATIHWSMVNNSPVMHYVNFLMVHGMKPYSDITDNNMPGAYLTDAWAMRVFGGGDLGWRCYDYFLIALMTAGMVVVARGYGWVAGVYAAGLWVAFHAGEGPYNMVEREQVVAVLLVVAYAALFTAVRRREAAWMAVFGFAGGLAGSIKPSFGLLPVALLGLMVVVLRRKGVRWGSYVAWGVAGMGFVMAMVVGFLVRHEAVRGVWFVVREVVPAYVGAYRVGWERLLMGVFPWAVVVVVVLGILLAVGNWKRDGGWGWEKMALAMGVGFGLMSYVVQAKGLAPHRYTYFALVFLLVGMELMTALRRDGWERGVALVLVGFTVLWVVPYNLRVLHKTKAEDHIVVSMESDLERLGGSEVLQGKVQCFDLVYGCLNALYRMRMVENTGFTGDLLLFDGRGGRAVEYYRGKFRELARSDPAEVMVVSNEWFERPNSFAKVDSWPEFGGYLRANYTEVVERDFPRYVFNGSAAAYRIYVRKGSPVMARAAFLADWR